VTALIFLVICGALVAWVWTRGRRKLKLPVTGKHWGAVIIIVLILLALLYGAHNIPPTANH
jgi:hypothetical protein